MTDRSEDVDFSREDKSGDTGSDSFTNQNQSDNEGNQDSGDFLEIDGRKYTKDDVVKKIVNADSFIETLKRERAEDRERLRKMEEQLQKASNVEKLLEEAQKRTESNPEQGQSIDPQEIARMAAELARQSLDQERRKAQLKQNWETVTETLTRTYGREEVNNRVRKIAKENDMTLQEARELAESRPKVFLAMFPEVKTKSAPPPKIGTSGIGLNTMSQETSKSSNDPKAAALKAWREAKGTKERAELYAKYLSIAS